MSVRTLAVSIFLVLAVGFPSDVRASGASTARAPRLIEQVTPIYPEAAGVDQHGDVILDVRVNVDGSVVAVDLVSGPNLFHDSAREAGFLLRFEPALQDGVAVPATVRVYFHFAPPSFKGDDTPFESLEVHSRNDDAKDTHARTTLVAEDLESSAGADLAETVSEIPGVRQAQGSSDSSKPIIRGHSERRLLVLYDGIRHESQKWGPDHATEIDPFSAGSISVIRGAAGARFGPDAIGGVILVNPPPMRDFGGFEGRSLSAFNSNGWGGFQGLRVDLVPENREELTLRVEGSFSKGASLSAPEYVLGNTASQQWSGGVAGEWRRRTGSVRVVFHHYDHRAGVFYGVQNGSPSDFESQLTAETPVNAEQWDTSYAIDRPYQAVTHDRVTLHANQVGQWGRLEGAYAFQINQREEFESAREAIEGPQYDFTLRSHSVDLLYRQPTRDYKTSSIEGGAGLQGLFQENVYRGYSLLPNYRSFSGGVFGFERLSLSRGDLSLAGRLDSLSRASYLYSSDYEKHRRQETLSEADCSYDGQVARCPNSYTSSSLSFGALVHLVPARLDLKLDLSTASRFPNVDELFLIGSAPSFPVYAYGDPQLGVERTRGASLTVGSQGVLMDAEISAFSNWVEDYIHFAPDLKEDGSLHYDVTIKGTWPRFSYRPIDALFYGVDGRIDLAPERPVGVEIVGALVRAQAQGSTEQLVGTLPDSLKATLRWLPPEGTWWMEPQIRFSVEHLFRQSRVDPNADFAPAPEAATLLGASIQVLLRLPRRDMRLGLDAHNLLNHSYREYTSLLRYYADQPGRDIRLRVGFDF